MIAYFHRMDKENKPVEVEGTLLISNGILRFYSTVDFECVLNGGIFEGNSLTMNVTSVSIHQPCIMVDGFYKISAKSFCNDSWSFYFNAGAGEF